MGKPSNPRLLRDNEAQAFAKTIRVSPQKLNLVAQSIRGLPVERALAELSFFGSVLLGLSRTSFRQQSRTQKTITSWMLTVWWYRRQPSVRRNEEISRSSPWTRW